MFLKPTIFSFYAFLSVGSQPIRMAKALLALLLASLAMLAQVRLFCRLRRLFPLHYVIYSPCVLQTLDITL